MRLYKLNSEEYSSEMSGTLILPSGHTKLVPNNMALTCPCIKCVNDVNAKNKVPCTKSIVVLSVNAKTIHIKTVKPTCCHTCAN